MRRLILTALLGVAWMLAAEMKPGENVLLNGRLEADQTDLPLYWTAGGPTGCVVWEPSGGPGNSPCVTLRNPKGKTGEFTFRQFGLRLVTNGLYRISAQIRTKDFKSRSNGAVVVNTGWFRAFGPKGFPANQPWTRVEKTFRPAASSDGAYSAVVFAVGLAGELSVADLRLEALDAAARAGTCRSTADAASRRPRLLPWGTPLRYIPRANPAIAFRAFGAFPADGCSVVCGDVKIPFAPGGTVVPLPAGFAAGTLAVRVVDDLGGTNVCESTVTARVVDPVDTAGHRRLNNLVTEVLSAPLADGKQERTFTATRDGWVFIAAPGATEVRLDGQTVIRKDTPRSETFRSVAYGPHTLSVSGGTAGARLVVRQIAEIFNYCPGVNSMVAENPPYDWEFQRKYVHPAVTTQNGGDIPGAHRAWFREQGYLWLANLGTTKLKDPDDLTRRLEGAAGLTQPWYDGVTCDEQFFGQPEMLSWYTHGLKSCANPRNRLIYTWIVGKPGVIGVDHEFLRASVDASGGRAKLLFEAYCRTKATEEEARAYLDAYVADTLRRYEAWCPGIRASTGVAFGNFNQIPILSLAHHPEVDCKYYLDMQLNEVANNPVFRDLGCTGYWGSYYADHELHRWTMRLLRHYCVDGRTEMLSARYGYTYLPGHVTNGDFRGSLNGWTPSGDIRTDTKKGLGSRSQNRWGGNGDLGDTFAVFTRAAGATNTLAQTVKGLVPGRKYCLQFATFDVDDMKADRLNPRDFGLRATLGTAAERHERLSWQHIDRRREGRYARNSGVARINLHHIVFTAHAAEIPLTLDDARAKPGERLGVNCLSLTPFFEE